MGYILLPFKELFLDTLRPRNFGNSRRGTRKLKR